MSEKDAVPTTWDEVFKHERFTQLNNRAKTAEAELETLKGQHAELQTKLEAAQKAATDAKAEADTLRAGASDVEQLTADLAAFKKQYEESQQTLAQKDMALLRMNVATELGLPPIMATRLQGSTRDELEADAKGLAELVAKPFTPGSPPPTPRTPASQPTISAEKMSDPEYVLKNQEKILKEAQEAN